MNYEETLVQLIKTSKIIKQQESENRSTPWIECQWDAYLTALESALALYRYKRENKEL